MALKTKNLAILVPFVVWCLALCICFWAGPPFSAHKLQEKFTALSAKDGLLAALSPLLVLVLTGILDAGTKARLVFWKFRHALPGHRAFTELAPKDTRINLSALERRLGSLPHGPADQNHQWYALYKQCADEPAILQSHGAFLLARDMATVSVLFAPMGPAAILLAGGAVVSALLCCGVMGAHYVVLALVARNHGNRFVCNVLAETSAAASVSPDDQGGHGTH